MHSNKHSKELAYENLCKNMACESCKIFVKDTLDELGISPVKVDLGEIETKEDVSDEYKKKLNSKIKTAEMELLEK